MAPSVELTRTEASTMGGLVEQLILRDYADECARDPRMPFHDTEEFWDTGNREHWKGVLIARHRHISGRMLDKLISLKRLKVPDISSWKARFVRRPEAGPPAPGDRNEIYEVKPDSHWGVEAGKRKFVGLSENFRDLNLWDYKLGSWYPEPPGPSTLARKTLFFEHQRHVAESFRFRLKRIERAFAILGLHVQILTSAVEVERREAGLLYYKICVAMRLDFQGEDAIARRVVRRLFEAMTSGSGSEVRERELEIAASYRRMDPKGRPLPEPPSNAESNRIEAVLRLEEMLKVESLGVVPELEEQLDSLGAALFSKLRGMPGEKFLLCADEAYVKQEILRRRELQKDRLLRLLRVRLPEVYGQRLAVGAAIHTGVVRAAKIVFINAWVLEQVTFIQLRPPRKPAETWAKYAAALRWLESHPAEAILIGAVTVYGTALLAAGAVAGAALAAPAVTGAGVLAPAGAGMAELTATPGVASSEAIAEGGFGLARGLASEALADAAVPVIEDALPVAEQTLPRLAASEVPAALQKLAREELLRLLSERLGAAAADEAEKAVGMAMLAAVSGERLERAVRSAGPYLGALAMPFAAPVNPGLQAFVGTFGPPEAPGALYMLKLRDGADPSRLEHCRPFDFPRFTDDIPGSPPRPDEKLYYLGLIGCL